LENGALYPIPLFHHKPIRIFCSFFAAEWMQFRENKSDTQVYFDERSESISPLLLGEGGREAAGGEIPWF
jgi:hypothetical protein